MSAPVEPTSRVVPGHSLLNEGSPFDDEGKRIVTGLYVSTDGPGCAKCSCGLLSPWMTSRRWRREWHRHHKGFVLARKAVGLQ